LVGDDVFGGGVRHRVRDCDLLSDREPVVFDGWGVAWGVAGWCGDFPSQFYRALRARARSGVSFGACGWRSGGHMGRLAPPEVVVLGDAAVGGVHVRVDDLGAVSLCGRRYRGDDYRDAWLCHWAVADPHPRGIQRIASKRMKEMELHAFARATCLLAVEKGGRVWVESNRMGMLLESKNASKDAGATQTKRDLA
jgi:hypothetical protein